MFATRMGSVCHCIGQQHVGTPGARWRFSRRAQARAARSPRHAPATIPTVLLRPLRADPQLTERCSGLTCIELANTRGHCELAVQLMNVANRSSVQPTGGGLLTVTPLPRATSGDSPDQATWRAAEEAARQGQLAKVQGAGSGPAPADEAIWRAAEEAARRGQSAVVTPGPTTCVHIETSAGTVTDMAVFG
jgi:hypothetical protein